jgi:hypothetical protein
MNRDKLSTSLWAGRVWNVENPWMGGHPTG